MEENIFASRLVKLENNVYKSLKGRIRLELLYRDIAEYCKGYADRSICGPMTVLDVGGGSGRFARLSAEKGHKVVLCDISSEMLSLAGQNNGSVVYDHEIRLLEADFLSEPLGVDGQVDLLMMHGSAEWMVDPEAAIVKAMSLVKPGGYLSLLIFNRDRNVFKRGINGLLLQAEQAPLRNKLTPPGGASPHEIRSLLEKQKGQILLQSGIRVFQGFFRQIDQEVLQHEQWLEQEIRYYRQEPFNSLGEHTHFIWQAGAAG